MRSHVLVPSELVHLCAQEDEVVGQGRVDRDADGAAQVGTEDERVCKVTRIYIVGFEPSYPPKRVFLGLQSGTFSDTGIASFASLIPV